MKTECFIAYSAAYRSFAESIVRTVEALGSSAKLFDEPVADAAVSTEAKRRIDRADLVVALLGPAARPSSPGSLGSGAPAPYPKSESDYALGQRKPMAIIVYPGTRTDLHDDRVFVEVDFWDPAALNSKQHQIIEAIQHARVAALRRRRLRRAARVVAGTGAAVALAFLAVVYAFVLEREVRPDVVECRDLAKFMVLERPGEFETPSDLPRIVSPFAAMSLECAHEQVKDGSPLRLKGYRTGVNEVYAPSGPRHERDLCGEWSYRLDVTLSLTSLHRDRGRLAYTNVDRVGLLDTSAPAGAAASATCLGAGSWLPAFQESMRRCTDGGTMTCDATVLMVTDIFGWSVRGWVLKMDDCAYPGCSDIKPVKAWTFADRPKARPWWKLRIPAPDRP
jgi:hypothetical protein